MEKNLRIKIILEKTNPGYSGSSHAYTQIYVTGMTVREVKEKVVKALEERSLRLEGLGRPEQAQRLRNSELRYVYAIY